MMPMGTPPKRDLYVVSTTNDRAKGIIKKHEETNIQISKTHVLHPLGFNQIEGRRFESGDEIFIEMYNYKDHLQVMDMFHKGLFQQKMYMIVHNSHMFEVISFSDLKNRG